MKNITIVDQRSIISHTRKKINWKAVGEFLDMRYEQNVKHFVVHRHRHSTFDGLTKFQEFLFDIGYKPWFVPGVRGEEQSVAEMLLVRHLERGDAVTLITASSRFDYILRAYPEAEVCLIHFGRHGVPPVSHALNLFLIPGALVSQGKDTAHAVYYSDKGGNNFARFLKTQRVYGTNTSIIDTSHPDSPWTSVLIPEDLCKYEEPSRWQVYSVGLETDEKGRYVGTSFEPMLKEKPVILPENE